METHCVRVNDLRDEIKKILREDDITDRRALDFAIFWLGDDFIFNYLYESIDEYDNEDSLIEARNSLLKLIKKNKKGKSKNEKR